MGKVNSDADDTIVISGVSGRYPKCDNIIEFRDSLMNKIDLISDDDVRYKHDNKELPSGIGHLNRLDQFDAGFFGIDHWVADNMDPMLRIMLEQAIEAIFDAGVNPKELEGTKTAVILAMMVSEAEISGNRRNVPQSKIARAGYHSTTFTQKISKMLKLKGPAFLIDTACSTSLIAIDHACKMIDDGTVDGAIVFGGNLILNPNISIQYKRMGVSAPNGRCKVFDESADGYGRSELIACVYMQKLKQARRAYAKILAFDQNSDGFKAESINFPSREGQATLLNDIYLKNNINPDELSYVEAHGTATKVGDIEETAAMEAAITKYRTKPLLIGSVKSNMGHSECASGFASISKCLMTLESGVIPPNLHFKKPSMKLRGIIEGRLKVVDEPTQIDDRGLIGISNFGFGGTNAHVLLKRSDKEKINGGIPEDDVPRLVLLSGRNERAVTVLQDDVKSRGLDQEYVALLNKVFGPGVNEHLYRGYSIVSKSGELIRSVASYEGQRLPLYIVFGSQFESWKSIGQQLMTIPKAEAVIKQAQDIIKKIGNVVVNFSLKEMIEDDPMYDILGNFVVLIGLTSLLKSLNLEPNCIFAYGVGKLAKLYFTNKFDLRDACSVALEISKVYAETLKSRTKLSNGNRYDIKQLLDSLVKPIDELEEKLPTESIIFNIAIPKECSQASKDKAVVLDINTNDFVVSLLQSLGKIFENGHQFNVENIYPKVEFPVSRGTPTIAPLIKWNHNRSWYVVNFPSTSVSKKFAGRYTTKSLEDLTNYVMELNGEYFFSAAGFLTMVWQKCFEHDQSVIFTNCHFNDDVTAVTNINKVELIITLDHLTGAFQILRENQSICRGYVKENLAEISLPKIDTKDEIKLNKTEIYNILALKGLGFNDEYKGLAQSNINATNGKIDFGDNWTAFLSSVFQLKQLKSDTKLTLSPTFVKSVAINPKKHLEFSEQCDSIEVNFWPSADVIKCGGVQVCGLEFKEVVDARTKISADLKELRFVPNVKNLSTSESVAVNLQLVHENLKPNVECNIVELVDESYDSDGQNLAAVMQEQLQQYKLFDNADIKILISGEDQQSKISAGIGVKTITNAVKENYLLYICTRAFQSIQKLENTINLIHPDGFVISRESLEFDHDNLTNVNLISIHTTDTEKLVMFTRKSKTKIYETIEASPDKFDWIHDLKKYKNSSSNVVLHTNHPYSGILNFAKALRDQGGYENVQCVLLDQTAPRFSLKNKLIADQLSKNIFINVYQEESWGTMRYGPPRSNFLVEKSNSSWEPSFNYETEWEEDRLVEGDVVNVHYVTLSSKYGLDQSPTKKNGTMVAFEYSGYKNGTKTAGLKQGGRISNVILPDNGLSWTVPDNWTLQEAATVSKSYYMAIMALRNKAKIRQKGTIAIRNAVTDVGLAAVNIAKAFNNVMYVSVSSEDDKKFLKENASHLKHVFVGDELLVHQIKRDTGGHGVDVVLDCSENNNYDLIITALKSKGTLVRINSNKEETADGTLQILWKNEISFSKITLDQIVTASSEIKKQLTDDFVDLLSNKFVTPLARKMFYRDELLDAVEFAAESKIKRKILMRVREGDKDITDEKFECLPRHYFASHSSYIVIGEANDLTLEFLRWMVKRGAKHIKCAFRTSANLAMRTFVVESLNEKGADITIFAGTLQENDVRRLIAESNRTAPLAGIFDFLEERDVIKFDDARPADFARASSETVDHVRFLHEHAGERLRDFAVFAPFAADVATAHAHGCVAQIVAQRRRAGLSARLVHWDPVLTIEEIAGKSKTKQDLSDCIRSLDFLDYCGAIVTSSVLQDDSDDNRREFIERLAIMLGMSLSQISPYSSLTELGINSVTLNEIKTYLTEIFGYEWSDDETRNLTFAKFEELLSNN